MTSMLSGQTINYPRDHFIFDIGAERWAGGSDDYNERWYSHMVAFSLFREWAARNNGLSLAVGGALSWHHHHSDLYWDDQGRFDLRQGAYDKNKISTFYADIPVEFRFRSKRNSKGNYFRIYLGAKAGYNLSSWQMYVDSKSKYKIYRAPGIQDWRYGVYVRTGWSFVSVFAQYMITPLFEEGHPVEAYPLSFGISLMAF
jgi:hypothetical protein